MKLVRIYINILLALAIVLTSYFIHLSLTPEGYTGIFIWFTYDVHSPRNPIIVLAVLIVAMVALNWKAIWQSKRKIRLAAMTLGAMLILIGVFFFLSYKRHNRFPWEQPNIIIIDVDTLRADHVSAYGSNRAKTPNIDSLAENGWLFERAYAHIPITMPSHSSLFTGRLPSDVWVLNNSDDFTYPEQTLAEILKEEGYKTGAAISLGVLRKHFKLSRGFDYYDDRLPGQGQWFNRADVITDRGIAWLKDNIAEDDKFFLWLHYSDPHEPYDPPGTPKDTSYELNGEQIGEGNLDSAATISVDVELKPGDNEIRINRLRGENIRPFFTYLYVTGIEEGPFPEEWRIPLQDARRINRSKFNQKLRALQTERFLSNFNGLSIAGLRFSEGPGWKPQEANSNRPRRSISSSAVIRVNNRSGESRTVTFNFKGGVNKTVTIVREDYAAEVEFADREIGRILDYIKSRGLMDNTIIVFLSDHGEELNEHGDVGHIHQLYTQSLHVPLIILDPNTDHKGRRITNLARLIDVTPTILDMAGLHKPTYMEGETLLEYILRNRSDERTLYSQTFAPDARENKFGIIEDNWLGIHLPDTDLLRTFEFYDLDEDGEQWRNLALSPTAGKVNEFASRTKKYAESITYENTPGTTDYEREEMLKNLGYMTESATPALLTDIGEPVTEVIDNVRHAAKQMLYHGYTDLVVEARSTGGSPADTGLSYITVEIELPADFDENVVMHIQDHIILAVLPQARQFPLRLILTSGDRLVMDRVFPGDPGNIVSLYSLRLLRLLVQQPLSTPLISSFEQLYPAARAILERNIGLPEDTTQ